MLDLLEYLTQQIAAAPNSYKRRYRKDMVKALINSYPEGTPIRGKEFNKALQYSPNSTGGTTLNLRMAGRGEISRTLLNPGANIKDRLYAYKVLVPGNTYDKERQDLALKREGYVNPAMVHAQRLRRAKEAEMLDKLEQAGMTPTPQTPVDNDTTPRRYSFKWLEEEAIRYQFYSDGHGTVSGFLTYLKGE